MSVQNRRTYDSDFKRNAVLLSEEPGRTVSEVAENLGINSDLIYRWRRQMHENGELAFPGHGKMALTEDQKRIRELEQENSRLREVVSELTLNKLILQEAAKGNFKALIVAADALRLYRVV